MIKGVHTMFYSSQAGELRAFIRDKLGFPSTDVGDGWLIFDLPEADMGCHPADPAEGEPAGTHNISFYCDNIGRRLLSCASAAWSSRKASPIRATDWSRISRCPAAWSSSFTNRAIRKR